MQFPRERVDLGSFGAGVAETAAHGFDGDSPVDQFGGVSVAELVDADADTGRGAVDAPAMVGGVVGQWPTAAVDAGAEQWPVGVAGAGEVEAEEGDVAPIVEQGGGGGSAPAGEAGG